MYMFLKGHQNQAEFDSTPSADEILHDADDRHNYTEGGSMLQK